MTNHRYKQVLILAALAAFMAWVVAYTHAVRIEEREVWMLDNTRTPTQVFVQKRVSEIGRGDISGGAAEHIDPQTAEKEFSVWEMGRGYREATQEEEEFEADRREGEQR